MSIERSEMKVLIRGAGEMASGVAHRLHQAGFKVLMTELQNPLAVRRGVSFSEAIFEDEKEIEGVKARFTQHASRSTLFKEIAKIWKNGIIPVIIDPELRIVQKMRFSVLIDARMLKCTMRNTEYGIRNAECVIGLGPGFIAGKDVDFVIETNRGMDLGRVIHKGSAQKNTKIPFPVKGFTKERVLYSPTRGIFQTEKEIGEMVQKGAVIGKVNGKTVRSKISGVIRGLLRNAQKVARGTKLGDIDPIGNPKNCFKISDKARAIGGGVLEAILYWHSTRRIFKSSNWPRK